MQDMVVQYEYFNTYRLILVGQNLIEVLYVPDLSVINEFNWIQFICCSLCSVVIGTELNQIFPKCKANVDADFETICFQIMLFSELLIACY